MKRVKLLKELRKRGYKFLRHGSNHDIWIHGKDEVAVPRHTEINENLAKNILKRSK